MTLTSVVVHKHAAKRMMQGQWKVIWFLQGFDGAQEVFYVEFKEDLKKGDDISRVKPGFAKQMQRYINIYKKEQSIINDPKMDAAVAAVQAVLEV